MAFGLPRVSLLRDVRGSKQAAVAATWEDAPYVVQVEGLARGVLEALAVDTRLLQRKARELVRNYRHAFRGMFGG